jgi:hypothetical protein
VTNEPEPTGRTPPGLDGSGKSSETECFEMNLAASWSGICLLVMVGEPARKFTTPGQRSISARGAGNHPPWDPSPSTLTRTTCSVRTTRAAGNWGILWMIPVDWVERGAVSRKPPHIDNRLPAPPNLPVGQFGAQPLQADISPSESAFIESYT